jgi:hypothetical protein
VIIRLRHGCRTLPSVFTVFLRCFLCCFAIDQCLRAVTCPLRVRAVAAVVRRPALAAHRRRCIGLRWPDATRPAPGMPLSSAVLQHAQGQQHVVALRLMLPPPRQPQRCPSSLALQPDRAEHVRLSGGTVLEHFGAQVASRRAAFLADDLSSLACRSSFFARLRAARSSPLSGERARRTPFAAAGAAGRCRCGGRSGPRALRTAGTRAAAASGCGCGCGIVGS